MQGSSGLPNSRAAIRKCSDMKHEVRAVIDIGTNSVKLLVGETDGVTVEPLHEQSAQTRLGRGFYETHILQAEPIAETVKAVAHFLEQVGTFKPERLTVLATSAARDAKNPLDLLNAIRQGTGHEVRIISGEAEADLVFAGVAASPGLANRPLMVVDIGGGSTELILGQNGSKVFSHSFRLGSVRLMETLQLGGDPTPEDWDRCQEWLEENCAALVTRVVRPHLEQFAPIKVTLVGTGGTPSILARLHHAIPTFDRSRIEGAVIPLRDLRRIRKQLWDLPLEARRAMPGLPPDRADVILTGASIMESIMLGLGFHGLSVSTRGLRFGALLL